MNNRYKELVYEGKTYTKKYQIDEILLEKEMNWFLDAEIENARIEIVKDTLIFNAGIIYNCVWEFGVIRDGDIRNITFENGVIYNGTFKKFTMEKGIIFGGVFIRGEVLFADIRGGDFRDVDISNNVNKTTQETTPQMQDDEQLQIAQPETTQGQVQVQGDAQGQEGQEIQAQIQESRTVKTYERFIKKD